MIINVKGEKMAKRRKAAKKTSKKRKASRRKPAKKAKKEEDSFLVFKKNALQNFLKGVFFI